MIRLVFMPVASKERRLSELGCLGSTQRWILAPCLAFNCVQMIVCASTIDTAGCSWTTVSPNGAYVFVGLCTRTVDEQIKFLHDDRTGEGSAIAAAESKIRDIHTRFSKQGMYKNDGSNRRIWTMPDWELEGMPTSNGERLVVPGRVAAPFDDSMVARVYGPQGIRFDVTVWDVVPSYIPWMSKLSHTKAALAYPEISDAYLGGTGDTLVVTTSTNDFIEISLDDGHVIQSTLNKRVMRQFFTSPVGVGSSIVIMALICGTTWRIMQLAWRRKRDRSSLA